MAQHDFVVNNQGFPAFRSDLNDFLNAVRTSHSGTSTPSGAVAGTIWLDTTSATTPTLKYYDGTDNISLATIDHVANTVNWLDSTVSITGLATTATGTVLTLSDTASTSSVNLIIDNQKEVRFRETTANGTNYVALKAPASLASDVTFTLPSADGTANQVLQTNGSGVLSFATVGGLEWQSVVTASTLTAVAGRGYWINTTSNACTVTLPASPNNGDTIILADYARKWGTNAVTINTNSLKFQGNTSPNPIYNTSGQSVTLVYSDATQGWIPTVDDNVSLETPQAYSIDFLVIAGGGSGGRDAISGGTGGGGGAGGYRTSTQTTSIGTVITVTVGDGGASVGGSAGEAGNNGSSSSISGSGLTTITSAGGGGGGGAPPPTASASNGKNGGSGGGMGNPFSTAGSGNTPSTSPSQGNNGGSASNSPTNAGGGGGGAGEAGGTDGIAYGGDGTASSITGTSVTRAGGGGGATNAYAGIGGEGGGGNGAWNQGTPASDPTSGTANTGGGGGGASNDNPVKTSGAGGKGVVILSMPTDSYSGTTTGSPTVTTSGGNTILTFTGSGSYTA